MHHFLAFELSESVCAVPLEEVHSIVHLPALSRPPGMPVLLEGFLNLRGKVFRLCVWTDSLSFPRKVWAPTRPWFSFDNRTATWR
ncbi:MAG TPA: chemotaxis protein CheW, partial [Vicinamibacteria bacterium]|nr:chemotaxis protein CheW [Vicinamibacteria bacterium]